jgi:hypothetical protein
MVLWVRLRSGRRGNHLGVRAGEELGLATVLPLHFVVLASRPSHHLDYLATSPSGADLGRLDDNPISVFCMHVSTSTVQPTPIYEGCIGASWSNKVPVQVLCPSLRL